MHLHPHQEFGVDWLSQRKFAILADEPGAGKTAQIVRACDKVGAHRILIACPAVVRHHWELEFERWSQVERSITVYNGHPKERPSPGVTIVSHAAFSNEGAFNRLREAGHYDVLVVDEVHEMRSYNAMRTQRILAPVSDKPFMPSEPGAWTWATYFWGLTGTPIVNSPADFWPLVNGPMRQPQDYIDWCFKYTQATEWTEPFRPRGIKDAEDLADLFRPVMLRRTLERVGIKLPELFVNEQSIELSVHDSIEINKFLKNMNEEYIIESLINDEYVENEALATVRRLFGMAKIPAVVECARTMMIMGHAPLVIFFQHTDVRNALRESLKDYRLAHIDGSVTKKQLRHAIESHENATIDILLVQIDAGGMGLTLTRGTGVLFAELSWSAVAQRQAMKRVHRIGQKRPVTVVFARARGYHLEEALIYTAEGKQRTADEFLNLIEV